MKDPARLVDASANLDVARLLRAGRGETPSDHAVRRTLTAITLGGGVAVSSVTSAAHSTVGTASTTTVASSSAALASKTSALGASRLTSTAGAGGVASATIGAKILAATGVAKWAGLGAITAASFTVVPEAVEWVKNEHVNSTSHGVESTVASRSEPVVSFRAIVPAASNEQAAPAPRGVSIPNVPTVTSRKQEPEAAVGKKRGSRITSGGVSDFAQQVALVEHARSAIARI